MLKNLLAVIKEPPKKVSYSETFQASAGTGTQLSPIAELVEKEYKSDDDQECDFTGFDDALSESSTKSVIDWTAWAVEDDSGAHIKFEDFEN